MSTRDLLVMFVRRLQTLNDNVVGLRGEVSLVQKNQQIMVDYMRSFGERLGVHEAIEHGTAFVRTDTGKLVKVDDPFDTPPDTDPEVAQATEHNGDGA